MLPWGGTKDAITGAWLHDTIEDCPPTNFDEIASLFGKEDCTNSFRID